MEKKFINELNNEELTKVLKNNTKLKEDVMDSALDTEMFWIREQLEYLQDALLDWSISPSGTAYSNYMKIKDDSTFIESVESLEKAVPALIVDDFPLLNKALEVKEKHETTDMAETDDDEIEEMEDELETVAEDLAGRIVYRWNRQLDYCFLDENLIDYFLDFYVDERMDDNSVYILVDGDVETYTDSDYELYEDVSYTKTFN